MPSALLSLGSGCFFETNYLVVVGEGARGTAERDAPVAIQALSVLAAGMQLNRRIDVRSATSI